MSRRGGRAKSIRQKIKNRATARNMTSNDADKAYAAVAIMNRLAQSPYVNHLYLKGGHLVASLLGNPHRATRDIDLLHATPHEPDVAYVREAFRSLASKNLGDGLAFEPGDVTAREAKRDQDEYDGVKVLIRASIEKASVEVSIDVAFGDVVVPPAQRISVPPFLDEQHSPYLFAYPAEAQIAEKVETMLTKLAMHRLKDIVDVVLLSRQQLDRETVLASMRATLSRRRTSAESCAETLTELRALKTNPKWASEWHKMLKDKAVVETLSFPDALEQFTVFVRPLLEALAK
jgi:hypothetical protein